MTSLKTKNICFLAAFLFLAIDPTLAKVVNEVKDCDQFLYQGTPPEIPGVLVQGKIQNNNRYKVICQTYEDVQRFLTVYDTEYKIPLFSAYEYTESVGCREGSWKIEPQLDEKPTQNNINMRTQGQTTCNKQAVDADYKDSKKTINNVVIKYHRGHLFPVHHASSQEAIESTFTLTNAVPQESGFNSGRWGKMEGKIKKEMDTAINNQNSNNKVRCFVVVGAQPSDNNIADNKLKNRVNIPSMMWSAFRCDNGESGGYWDKNIKRDKPPPMDKKTLDKLEDELGTNDPNLKGIVVFPNQPGQKRPNNNPQQPQAGPSKKAKATGR